MSDKIGWFEFEWKASIGQAICNRRGHKKPPLPYGRCRRCLKLLDDRERKELEKKYAKI